MYPAAVPIPAKKVHYATKQQAKSHAHEREEVVLLKKVDRLRNRRCQPNPGQSIEHKMKRPHETAEKERPR